MDLHHIYPTHDFTNDILYRKLSKEIMDVFQDKLFSNNLKQRLVDVELKHARGKVIFVYRGKPGNDTKCVIPFFFWFMKRPKVTFVRLRTKRLRQKFYLKYLLKSWFHCLIVIDLNTTSAGFEPGAEKGDFLTI